MITNLLLLILLFLAASAYVYLPWTLPHIEKIKMEEDGRMLRIGLGKNAGRWFLRIDFWFFGIRIS